MRIVIVSDIHANLAALEAVLRHAESQGPIDGAWCLGDTVGYGPQPRECVAWLREMGAVAVAGNHDRAATGKIGTEEFNADAAAAARWTAGQLRPEDREYLDGLPEVVSASGAGRRLKPAAPGEEGRPSLRAKASEKGSDPSLKAGAAEGEWTLVHGTLRWPIWEYLYSYEAAQAHLERQSSPFSLVGHTHLPTLVVEGQEFARGCEMYYVEDGGRVRLTPEKRLVLNPGGVGQPRDGDPRAGYALYDSDEGAVTFHRVEYHIAATQKLMEAAALPRWLIERLALGR
ncbi:MAG TPA: metallophosphoesterase family protein [Dehalococcoidia bacterium]|nr:metallophosphoesterase family protein [Dehalococcoidia bacterium]